MNEKRVLLVGIGNSSVDIADELVSKGKYELWNSLDLKFSLILNFD